MEYDYSGNYILKLPKFTVELWNIRPLFHIKIHTDRLIVPRCTARIQKFDLISNFWLGQY